MFSLSQSPCLGCGPIGERAQPCTGSADLELTRCKNESVKEEYSPSRLDAGLLGKEPAHRLGEYLFLFLFFKSND